MNSIQKSISILGIAFTLTTTLSACNASGLPTVVSLNKAEAAYQEGVEKASEKDCRGAIERYTDALRANPDYAEAYSNRGNAFFNLNHKEEAIKNYNRAIQLDPELAEAFYNRGVALYQLGDRTQAIEDYTQALKLKPDYVQAYGNRAVARSHMGDNQGAIEDYTQVLKYNPSLAEIYYNRGFSHNRAGNRQGAVQDLQKAIDLFSQQDNSAGVQKVRALLQQIQS